MYSSFLHGLEVSSHIAMFSQISLWQPGSSVHVMLACWCFIVSSNDILHLDMIQRQAVSVAQFFFGNIDIIFLDHINIAHPEDARANSFATQGYIGNILVEAEERGFC